MNIQAMCARRVIVFIAGIAMSCGTALSQQPSSDNGQSESAYLFCGDNPKRRVAVFAHPCEREPLRMAACGETVKVIEQNGDWLKVVFDPKDEAFVKAAEVSSQADHFQAVLTAKEGRPYSTPECVGYMMAKAKGQPLKGRFQPPRAVFTAEPPYPRNARGVTGTVGTWCTVGVDGRVHRVDVVKSVSKELDEAAITALKTWRFEPAKNAEGKPVETRVQINMNFSRLH